MNSLEVIKKQDYEIIKKALEVSDEIQSNV